MILFPRLRFLSRILPVYTATSNPLNADVLFRSQFWY